MNDNWRDPDAEVDDDDTANPTPRAVSDLAFASSLLRGAAVVSLGLWVIGVASSMWFQWTQLDGFGQLEGQRQPPRLLGSLAAGLTQTWGYLLVAVVAFAAAALLAGSVTEARTEHVAEGAADERA